MSVRSPCQYAVWDAVRHGGFIASCRIGMATRVYDGDGRVVDRVAFTTLAALERRGLLESAVMYRKPVGGKWRETVCNYRLCAGAQ